MVQCVLTGHEIETPGLKGEPRAIRLHPCDVWRFRPRLTQHSQRPVEPDQPAVRHNGAVRYELAARAAADIQDK